MHVVLSNHKDIISYHHLQRHKSGSYNFRCNEGIHVEMDSQRKIQVLNNMYKYIIWNSDTIIYTPYNSLYKSLLGNYAIE